MSSFPIKQDFTFPVRMSTPTENNGPESSEIQPNKRRRKKSMVWEHFTVEPAGAGCTRACCKQCKQTFAYSTGSKIAGTSHLKRHIALGTCPAIRRNQEKNQLTPYTPTASRSGGNGSFTDPLRRRYRGIPGSTFTSFDQDRCRQEIVRMIIMHEYPLHMVEHPAFVSFVQTLQPQFDMVSFSTVQGDCVAMYLMEKQKLLKLLGGITGQISLTLDLWTSSQTLGYVFLTGHFIDNDWKLHRRLLNVVMEPSPYSDDALNHAVMLCLADWGLESKLFTLTLDQSFSNDTAIGNLRGLLSMKNPFMLNGQLLISHCYARVLSSIAQDALCAMGETISKVRESVKYVKTSDTHEEKFIELKQQLQVPSTKRLSLDDQTQWNTTYHMLVAAFELKEVFSCLDTYDPDYKQAPSMDDWKQVETLCTYLKLLYDAANVLTAKTYPTSNTFFHEVWKIQLELTHAATIEDPLVSNLARPLHEKFNKYWNNCGLVLAIAVVMDPRFKLKLVEFSFSKIYGDEAAKYVKFVDEGIHELFLEYAEQPLSLTAANNVEENALCLTAANNVEEGNAFSLQAVNTVEGNVLSPIATNVEERNPPSLEVANVEEENAHCITATNVEEGNALSLPEANIEEGKAPSPTATNVEERNALSPAVENVQEENALSLSADNVEEGEGAAVSLTVTNMEERNALSPAVENVQEENALCLSAANVEQGEGGSVTVTNMEEENALSLAATNMEEDNALSLTVTNMEEDNALSLSAVNMEEGDAHSLTVANLEEANAGVAKREIMQGGSFLSSSDGLSDFEVYLSMSDCQQTKSELDQYLEESLLPRVWDFDILSWWKLNNIKYPTLSRMAHDILSIPISTVTPDSVFDTVPKEMDRYQSSLRPETLEALICTRDWLQYEPPEDSSNAIVKLEY